MRLSESKISLSEEKLIDILKLCLSEYTSSRDWKIEKGYIDMGKECYRLYRGIAVKKSADEVFRSNYFRPLTGAAVENILPRLAAGLFATDPFFRFLGTKDADVKPANNLGKLVYYKMMYEVPFMLQAIKLLKNCLVYGYGVMYYPWLVKRKRRLVPYAKDKMVVYQNTIDSAYPRAISFWDVYPQPGVEYMSDGNYVYIREIVTPSELYQRASKPGSPYIIEQVNKILEGKKEQSFPSEDTSHYEELDAMVGLGSNSEQYYSGRVELLHRFGIYDFAKSNNPTASDIESWIVMANRVQIVMAIHNPYDCQEWPLEEFRPVPNTHGLLGIPLPQMGRDVQLEANDQMNFRLDQQNFIGNKVTKVKRNSDIYEKLQRGDIVLYPGATIPVDDQDDVMELAFSSVDSSLYIDDNILTNEYDKILGVHDVNTGRGDSRQRTASGTSMIIRESNYRYDLMLKNLIPSFMQMMQKIGYFTQQFGISMGGSTEFSLENIFYPTKREKFGFNYSQIQCAFMTMMLSSSTKGDRSYHFALLQSLRQLLGGDPNIDLRELDRQLLEEAELNNIDKLLKEMPVTPPPTSVIGGGGNVPAEAPLGPVTGGMKGAGGPVQDMSNTVNVQELMSRGKENA